MHDNFDIVDKNKLCDFNPTMGQGVCLFDNDKKILDLSSGISFGYGNNIIDKSIIKTLNTGILFTSKSVNLKIKQEINEILCFNAGFFDINNTEKKITGKVAFCNSAESAIETAIKTSLRRYNILCDRDYSEIIVFDNCFHGQSIATMSCSNDNKQNAEYKPLLNNFKIAKFNNIKSVESLITENTSAILIEPLQLYYGLRRGDTKFLQELRSLCDKHEIVLIFDDTKCGCYKVGSFFSYEYTKIIPDIVCIANSFAGGYDFGACIMNEEVSKFYKHSNALNDNVNNILLNISKTILQLTNNAIFFEKISQKIDVIKNNILNLKNKYSDIINNISVEGFLCTIQFYGDINNHQVFKILFANGLLVKIIENNSILLDFPFIITNKQVEEVIEIIEITLKEISIIERY